MSWRSFHLRHRLVLVLERLDNVNGFDGNVSSFYRVRTEGGIEAYIQMDSVRALG
jgi:hypothetical protein